MASFCVIHLSDLHIGENESPSYERLRDALVKDLAELVSQKQLSVNALAVTGDIVDRGGTQNAYTKAKRFLQELTNVVGLTPKQVVIVPGNHDVPRRALTNKLIAGLDQETLNDPNSSEEVWQHLRHRFQGFYEFEDTVCGCSTPIRTLFGASYRDIEVGSRRLRFLQLNSAWATAGESDYHKLRLSLNQLERLAASIRAAPVADLTLAMLHHPFEWLHPEDADLLQDFLTKPNLMPVDAILHGHVHTGRIQRLQGPDYSLLSLVTGVGYPEAHLRQRGQPKLSECRYAVYRFELESPWVRVFLRTSRPDGTFTADNSLYHQGSEFPMPFRDAGPYTSFEKTPPPPGVQDRHKPGRSGVEEGHPERRQGLVQITIVTDELNANRIEGYLDGLSTNTGGSRVSYERVTMGSLNIIVRASHSAIETMISRFKSGAFTHLGDLPVQDVSWYATDIKWQEIVEPTDRQQQYARFFLGMFRPSRKLLPKLKAVYTFYQNGIRWYAEPSQRPFGAFFRQGGYLETELFIPEKSRSGREQIMKELLPLQNELRNRLGMDVKLTGNGKHGEMDAVRLSVVLAGASITHQSRWAEYSSWILNVMKEFESVVGPWLARIPDISPLPGKENPKRGPQQEQRYDVFVAYNSRDVGVVLELQRSLMERGIRPWIDVLEIRPGEPFQDAIQSGIQNSRAAAVFIGPDGVGRWQALELRTLISQFVESGRPVIPVLLPGLANLPSHLLFLRELNWVQLQSRSDTEALDNLEWGITGRHPRRDLSDDGQTS